MSNKIGIIGAGAMGQGIAQVALTQGELVFIYDAKVEMSQKAITESRANLEKLISKGKFDSDKLESTFGNLHSVASFAEMGQCDIVIEAAVENLDIKRQIFEELESIVTDHCILASNTSSLSITSIASACKRPERVIGMHFFNPASIMPLVEVIPAIQTSEQTSSKAKSLVENWGKTVVMAKDTPGFIVNRIARPFYGEAIRIYEEGIAEPKAIDAAMTSIGGFKMGPFALMDFIGHDVNYAVTESVFSAFYFDPRYKPSFTQKRLVEAGYLGRKSGRGFYNYPEGPNNGCEIDPKLAREIFERILAMLINEAADALFQCVATKEDIDLAMVKGTNYPQGLLAWADDLGISYVVSILHGLYAEYQEDRYRCSPLLQRMARNYEQFY